MNAISKSSYPKKRIIALLVICIIGCFSAAIFVFEVSANGQEYIPTVEAVQEYRSVYRLPKATVKVGEELIEAQTILVKPNGEKTSAEAVTLDMAGVYGVQFWASGKQVAEQQNFTVYYPYVEFNGKGSTAEYASGDGLKIKTRAGVRATFNQIIDLSTVGANDALIKMYVTPSVPGNQDFSKFDIILTDIHDESNYLTIEIVNTNENGKTYSYVKAGASFQPLTGRENGNPERIHAHDMYGSPVKWTFYGNPADEKSNLLSIYYDAQSKRIYAQDGYFVIDLDDKKYFSDLWSGFTSGKVKMTLVAGGGTVANYALTEVYGLDLKETVYIDNEKPVIDVKVPDTVPAAKTGLPYKIFEATAFDDYAKTLEVTKKVFVNYYSDSPYSVAIKDGAFIPGRSGSYTIVYSAADHFGNEAIRTIDVKAYGTIDEMVITLAGAQEGGKAGEWIEFAPATVSGGSGEIKVTVTIESEHEYDIAESSFKPRSAGSYTIVYTAEDYLGSIKTFKNTVEVEVNPDPVYEEDFYMPLRMISGAKYKLPEVLATDFNTGKSIESKIIVTDNNGERTLNGYEYIPEVNESGKTVIITYMAISSTGKAEKCFSVPVYAVGYGDSLDMSAYFVGENLTKKYTDVGLDISFNGDSTIAYANSVLADRLELNFGVNSSSSSASVTLNVIDKCDPSKSMYVRFVWKNGAVVADVNGENTAVTDFKFTSSGENITVAYDVLGNKIKIGTKFYELKTKTDFTDGHVFLEWQFEGTANTTFSIYRLNKQIFSSDTSDLADPQIALQGERGGKTSFGSIYRTSVAYYGDVLDPFVTCVMTVTDPDGKAVTDTDGRKLEKVSADIAYYFECGKYGVYSLSYSATDTSGNTLELGFAVKVWDGEPPVVTVEKSAVEATAGQKITLPSATAKDLVSGDREVFKCIKTPDGTIVNLKDGEYVFESAGTYYIYYYATDANGNLGKTIVKVSVKEAGK